MTPAACRGTCQAIRALVVSLPARVWRAAATNSVAPGHPILSTASPMAYLQQAVQLHTRITSPGTWSVQRTAGWAHLSGCPSPDFHFSARSQPGIVRIFQLGSSQQELASCELPDAVQDGYNEFVSTVYWAHDSRKLAVWQAVTCSGSPGGLPALYVLSWCPVSIQLTTAAHQVLTAPSGIH